MSSKKNWRDLDPEYQSEAKKYAQPIPSRRYLLHVVESHARPMSHAALFRALGLRGKAEKDAVTNRVGAMLRAGQLVETRRGQLGLPDKMDLIKGRVIGHPDGYGFVQPEDGQDDLYLSRREMQALMHGDDALVRVRGIDSKGRREAGLVEVLARHTETIVGRYYCESGVGYVDSENRRITHPLMIPKDNQGHAKPGQIVTAQILEQPGRRQLAVGKIVEVLGDHMAPGLEIEVAIRNYDLPHLWPQSVLKEAERYGDAIPDEMGADRHDLRSMPFVTIDGETARDFDDAVYCQPEGKGWRLWVAIADVASYVEKGSALDIEAHNRGNSVYFPDHVLPMLPEKLSNGLCSLNPEVDRWCLVCEMIITHHGQVKNSKFYRAVFRSSARLTYTEVGDFLACTSGKKQGDNPAWAEQIKHLFGVYRSLHAARVKRGHIDFSSQEMVIEFGPERKIDKLLPVVRNDAHRLIEVCMIAANVEAARFLSKHEMPILYRVHESPPASKLEDLKAFLGLHGLTLSGGEQPSAKDYADLMVEIGDRPDRQLLETMMLRSLSQAMYSPTQDGHFGLALEHYAHFTSPIRRYPDLLVHRAIHHVLDGGVASEFAYQLSDMQALGTHCSMTERRADEATRDVMGWLKCEYMLDKIGEEYSAIVTGVTSFGLFVSLDGLGIEGLVHVTSLDNDYYHYDQVAQRLVGEHGGKVYCMSDSIQVRVVRVDLDQRKIDFEPVGVESVKVKSTRPRKGIKRRRKQ